eukprot:2212343-Pleurochrysis_carterae.AAC.1
MKCYAERTRRCGYVYIILLGSSLKRARDRLVGIGHVPRARGESSRARKCMFWGLSAFVCGDGDLCLERLLELLVLGGDLGLEIVDHALELTPFIEIEEEGVVECLLRLGLGDAERADLGLPSARCGGEMR